MKTCPHCGREIDHARNKRRNSWHYCSSRNLCTGKRLWIFRVNSSKVSDPNGRTFHWVRRNYWDSMVPTVDGYARSLREARIAGGDTRLAWILDAPGPRDPGREAWEGREK